MIKKYYNAKDVSEILGYAKDKSYRIIRELNSSLKIETEQSGREIITFPGRIPIWYFNKKLGIEGNK